MNKLTKEFLDSIKPEIPAYKVFEIYECLIDKLIDRITDDLSKYEIREIFKEVKEELNNAF